MRNHFKFMIIGLILIFVGGAIATPAFLAVFPDPSDEAEWEGSFWYAGGYENATLDSGEYDVWVTDAHQDVRIRIFDGSDVIFDENTGDHTETININGKDYYKLGSFEVDGGTYDVHTDGHVEVYITPPLDIWGAIGTICGGALLIVIGIILLLVGIVKLLMSTKKGQQPPPYHGPPPYGEDPYRGRPDDRRDPYDGDYRPPRGDYPAQDEHRRRRRPPPRGYDR